MYTFAPMCMGRIVLAWTPPALFSPYRIPPLPRAGPWSTMETQGSSLLRCRRYHRALYGLALVDDFRISRCPLLYHPSTDFFFAINHFFPSPVANKNSSNLEWAKGIDHAWELSGPPFFPYLAVPRSWSFAGCQVRPSGTWRTSRQPPPSILRMSGTFTTFWRMYTFAPMCMGRILLAWTLPALFSPYTMSPLFRAGPWSVMETQGSSLLRCRRYHLALYL
mmetsp:Transcript_81648/g.218436  ORF Transcript_81648/g.218436 Transcript_81648/m.218436 type:complete len:221 (+) Transcript_81648:2623-3285(+)